MKWVILDKDGEPTVAWWVVFVMAGAMVSLPFLYYLQWGHF